MDPAVKKKPNARRGKGATIVPVGRPQEDAAAEFRVRGSDQRGISERVWIRMMPLHHRQMSAIVTSKKFPYRTSGDLLRHAFVRHVEHLKGLVDGVPSVHMQVDAIMEVLRDDEMQADFDRLFLALRERVTVHQNAGRSDMAVALVKRVTIQVDEMPDGPWQKTYRKELRKNFGRMIEAGLVPKR